MIIWLIDIMQNIKDPNKSIKDKKQIEKWTKDIGKRNPNSQYRHEKKNKTHFTTNSGNAYSNLNEIKCFL